MNIAKKFLTYSVRMTQAERRALELLAEREALKPSEYMRSLLRREMNIFGVPAAMIGMTPQKERQPSDGN